MLLVVPDGVIDAVYPGLDRYLRRGPTEVAASLLDRERPSDRQIPFLSARVRGRT